MGLVRYEKRLYAPIDDADKEGERPDFAVLVYPGHLTADKTAGIALNPNVPVTSDTPPTFLVQAENDTMDGVHPGAGLLYRGREGWRAGGDASVCTRRARIRLAAYGETDHRLTTTGGDVAAHDRDGAGGAPLNKCLLGLSETL
jgi:hypothetical protein